MNNDSTTTILDTVILCQMLVENLEELQTTKFNRQKIKMITKNLLSEITPICEAIYDDIFNIDENTVMSITKAYEIHIRNLRGLNIPDKVALAQFTEARRLDLVETEKGIHEILKKHL